MPTLQDRNTAPVSLPAVARQRALARRLGIGWPTFRRHLAAGDRWCFGHADWHPAGDFAGRASYCRAWRREYCRAWRRGVTLVRGRREAR